MFLNKTNGWIEVICGPMFAGKTEELIRRVRRLDYANQKTLLFKPASDKRYSEENIVSHNMTKVKAISIEKSKEVLDYINNEKEEIHVVVIDEIQFFDEEIIEIVNYLADRGLRVICAGLDKDFRGEPFKIMSHLLSISEFITKLTSICTECFEPATRSQRLVNGKPAKYDDPIVLIGAKESYEPRCRHHHYVEGKKNKYDTKQ